MYMTLHAKITEVLIVNDPKLFASNINISKDQMKSIVMA